MSLCRSIFIVLRRDQRLVLFPLWYSYCSIVSKQSSLCRTISIVQKTSLVAQNILCSASTDVQRLQIPSTSLSLSFFISHHIPQLTHQQLQNHNSTQFKTSFSQKDAVPNRNASSQQRPCLFGHCSSRRYSPGTYDHGHPSTIWQS